MTLGVYQEVLAPGTASSPNCPVLACTTYTDTFSYKVAGGGPTASFTATQAAPATDPGEYQLVSTSTAAAGQTISGYKWDFADGSTATGAAVTHTFTTPDAQSVTLTVTDTDGGTSSVTQTVTVPAPMLQVGVIWVDASGNPVANPTPQEGGELFADLTLAASTGGVGGLTKIAAPSGQAPLQSTANATIGVPTPAFPASLTLARGASVSYIFPVTVGDSGPLTLTVPVFSAVDAAGNSVRSTAQQLSVNVSELQVGISTKTSTVNSGQPIAATVTYTNVGSVALSTLTGTLSATSSPAAKIAISGKNPDQESNLAPGSSISSTYQVTPSLAGKLTLRDSATYVDTSGDTGSAGATALIGVVCSNGKAVELDSVVGIGGNGYEVGQDATVKGCGLYNGLELVFNDQSAQALVSGVNDDATQGTVVVPWAATNGPVSVAGSSGIQTPNAIKIDSMRNTDGFEFHNYDGAASTANLLAAFPAQAATMTDKNGNLLPKYQAKYNAEVLVDGVPALHGECYGMALLTAEFSQGYDSPDTLSDSAPTGWQLPDSHTVEFAIETDWWKQFADQTNAYHVEGINGQTVASYESNLATVLGSNGFDHPALLSFSMWIPGSKPGTGHFDSHEVVGFGYSIGTEGQLLVYTADSNVEFHYSENSNDTLHNSSLAGSTVTVHNSGGIAFYNLPFEDMYGPVTYTDIVPVTVLEGPLTLLATPNVNQTLGADTSVVSGTNVTTGQDMDVDDPNSAYAFSAPDDATAGAPTPTSMTGPDDTYQTVVTSPVGLQQFWGNSTTSADFTAGAGTATTEFAPATDALTLGSTPQPSAQVTRDYGSGSTAGERAVDVTSPDTTDLALSLTPEGTIELSSEHGGTFSVTATNAAVSESSATTLAKTVTLLPGEQVSLVPNSWTLPADLLTVATIIPTAAANGGSLSATGTEIDQSLLLAAGLVIAGALLSTLSRRPRRKGERG